MKIVLNERANIGPCMDVKAYKGLLYAIQNGKGFPSGRLCVLRPDLSLVDTYEGIGNARQIEIVNDIAVVTAREDGIWIFDVSQETPVLLSYYKTVEFATGVALWGNLAFISCRVYGVQILDISNPRAPVHISLVQVGEIQSATVKDGILYCGAWGNKEVTLVDINDPQNPKVLSKIPLQGQGDGVCVKDNVLYAATGHERRYNPDNEEERKNACASGNGVECFDVSDPINPKRIKGIFFEPGRHGVDLWEVSLYGETLLVNNSILGAYGLHPQTLEQKFRLLPPILPNESRDAVTGLTVLGKDVFVATAYGDLFVQRGLPVSEQEQNNGAIHVQTSPQPFRWKGTDATVEVVHQGTFPVLALAETKDVLVVACNGGGIHLLDRKTLACRAVVKTNGSALDVKICNNKLYVAEGTGGVEIFELNGTSVKRLGGFKESDSIHQINVSKSGKYLLCAIGCGALRMYDVQDASNVCVAYECLPRSGILYGYNFAANCLDDGTMLSFGHARGMMYTNPDKGDKQFTLVRYKSKKGNCGYGVCGEGIETDGKHIFYANGGKYMFLSCDDAEDTFIEDLPQCETYQHCTGLLTLQDGLMIAANRRTGEIWLLDIVDVQKPKLLAKVSFNGSPLKPVFSDGRIFIPAGVHGLLEIQIQKNIQ